ncbi:MAG: histidinol-phosphate transaminase [Candidatus Aminicenantes bacterium]|jgi:histidinol-phosphate aminotransferase
MAYQLNRRQWLKTSAIAAAGLIAGSNFPACRKDKSFLPTSPNAEDTIRLNSNESPYGISENAQQAIIGSIDQSNRYPQRHYSELEELIAEKENISPDNIFLGAGSTEVMTTLIHLYGMKGETLVADPTYFDFVWYAERVECPLQFIPLNENFEHDLQAMQQRIHPKTSLVYICNPNNPTGSITPEDKLRSFCERTSQRSLVFVDEAYHEYVDDRAYSSMIDLVKEGRNVVVTRTFSKIFGMAGLRVGYGMARPDIVEDLERIERNFAPISWLSLKAALECYKNVEFTHYVKQKNSEVKSYLYKELERLGLFYVPSHTNFVLIKVNQDSREMSKKFEDRNILILPFQFNDENWIRVSLGTMEEIQTFASALSYIA